MSSSKIKILHIIKSLGRGGAEMLLPESLKLHNKEQFEFHYIYFLPWKNQMVEALERAGGKVTCIPASNNLSIILQARRIAQYVKKNNIQVIHAHLPWAGFVARVVHRLTKVPLIYTEHNKQERYHFLTRRLNRSTFNWQDLAIAVSEDVEKSINQNISPSIKIKKVLNGVNTEYFQRNEEERKLIRAQHKIKQDAVVIGTVAVFRFQKRLKEWLEVFAAASQVQPNLVGIIVGDGPLKSEIVQHIQTLNIENKIIMPGLQTEVRPWYAAMDIFMMTSVFEGLPVALLEAMSMQCVVVTTDAGGIKEVIVNKENGLMETVDNWQELPQRVSELVADPNKRIQLGGEARKTVIGKFGMNRMVKELEQTYKDLCVLAPSRLRISDI